MIHNCSGSSLRSNKESFQTLLIFCDGQTHFFVLFLQQPYCFSYNHFNWNRLWAPCILLFLIRNNVIIFYFVVYFSFGLPNYLCTINSIVILHVFPAVLFTPPGMNMSSMRVLHAILLLPPQVCGCPCHPEGPSLSQNEMTINCIV